MALAQRMLWSECACDEAGELQDQCTVDSDAVSERSTTVGSEAEFSEMSALSSDVERSPKLTACGGPPGVFSASNDMQNLRTVVVMPSMGAGLLIPVAAGGNALPHPWPCLPLAKEEEGSPESLEAHATALARAAAQLRQAARRTKKAAMTQGTLGEQPLKGVTDKMANGARSNQDKRTTLMFRNLPSDYTRNMLCEMLDSEGFGGWYDLVYLPRDFKRDAGLGYSFINFESNKGAVLAMQHFEGFNNWQFPSRKVLEVVWSNPVQGLSAHVERLRNSPAMAEQMPDCYKPILLRGGVRIEFPAPTKKIRAPKM